MTAYYNCFAKLNFGFGFTQHWRLSSICRAKTWPNTIGHLSESWQSSISQLLKYIVTLPEYVSYECPLWFSLHLPWFFQNSYAGNSQKNTQGSWWRPFFMATMALTAKISRVFPLRQLFSPYVLPIVNFLKKFKLDNLLVSPIKTWEAYLICIKWHWNFEQN